jgi:hypothetical protein
MPNRLHIICLDVPFPADYGGAIDMFYRIQALHELGLKLTLHVFHYGRAKQSELEKYGEVVYYERQRSVRYLFSKRPFIVQSRMSTELLANLRKDDAPILFEGIHTTWPLELSDIRNRVTFVRMHNLEDEYYGGLRKHAPWFQKFYFELERMKLKRYAKILRGATHVLGIKSSDVHVLKAFNSSVHLLPASIPPINTQFHPVEPYALFHGNLSVAENEQAAKWIIKTLGRMNTSHFPLIIAGKNPSRQLATLCEKAKIQLIANPSKETLDGLVNRAQIHLLYTDVASGVKLKLINCLAGSGQVLVNRKMIEGTGLDALCTIAEDEKSFTQHFLDLCNVPLSEEAFMARQHYLKTHFNTTQNCGIIQELLAEYN